MKKIILLFFLFVTTSGYSQWEKNLNLKLGDYTYTTKYDTASLETSFKLIKNGRTVFTGVSEFMIDTVMYFDINNTGQKNIFISEYSGGAHCCFYLLAGVISDDKIKIYDTLYIGNVLFEFKDLNNDGKFELQTNFDGIAYAFTNYAETRFPLLIYSWNGYKFEDITSKYPDLVKKEIDIFMPEIAEIKKDPEFKCLGKDDDTFNTPAGSLKTVLTAIAYSYMSIGETSKGIDLINKNYNCPDKQKFLNELNEYYKIK